MDVDTPKGAATATPSEALKVKHYLMKHFYLFCFICIIFLNVPTTVLDTL